MKRTLKLIFVGLLPWLAGELVNRTVLFFPVPMLVWNLILLGLWGFLGYILIQPGRNVWAQTGLMHLFGAVMLVLNLVQQLAVHAWWPGILGSAAQLYFIPALQFGMYLVKPFIVFPKVITMDLFWPAYPVAFGIMIVVCLVGARIGKRQKMSNDTSR